MAKAAVWRWGCHGDRLLSEADTRGSVVVPVCVTAPLSDVRCLLLGYAASESSSGSPQPPSAALKHLAQVLRLFF